MMRFSLRASGPLPMGQDLAHALRIMLQKPGFALVVILTMALGIGANTAVFGTLYATLLRPLPFPEADQLVLARTIWHGHHGSGFVSAADFYDYRDQSKAFDSLAALSGFTRTYTITGRAEPELVSGFVVSWNFSQSLGVPLQLGRYFTFTEGTDGAPDVAIISHGYWQRRFGGSREVLGKTFVIDGQPHTVIGVLPAAFHFLYTADLWLSMRPGDPYASARRFHNCLLVGRLKSGITLEKAQSEIDVISARLERQYPDSNKGEGLRCAYLQEALVERYRKSLFLLMAANAMVLLIACANVAGLLLARGSTRREELAVRAALGATPTRLISQLLTESSVMALAAGILGVILAGWLQKLIVKLLSINLPGVVEHESMMPTLLFALVLSLGAGLMFGIAPALRGARPDAWMDLNTASRSAGRIQGSRLRSGLVVAQVALSIVLLVCFGLLFQSYARLRGVDPGFNTANMLTAEIRLTSEKYSEDHQRIQFYQRLMEEIRLIPGVRAMGAIDRVPIGDPGQNTHVHAADNPPLDPRDQKYAYDRTILPGYMEAMGIPLLAGRTIQDTDKQGFFRVLVINETMARKLFPGQNPIGQRVVVDVGQKVSAEIVGVVGNVQIGSLAEEPEMAMYGSYWQRPRSRMKITIRTLDKPESLAPLLRQAVWSLDKDIPVAGLASMEEIISDSVARPRINTVSLALLALLALLLAALGLYGVLSYNVSWRRHEIGIRMAVGASSRSILSMVLAQGLYLVAAGLLAGLAGAWWASGLLQGLLYGIEPTDPITFAFACLFFVIVALLACIVPARRAVRVDPVIALRTQ